MSRKVSGEQLHVCDSGYGQRMRILHTSDWHLGRTLHGVDLMGYQAAYLEHLIDVARTEQVGAVVIAGDVYDRAIPPVEAVNLLSETLQRLSEFTSVVLTPGNHDSAARLGFGAELMRENLHVRAKVAQVGQAVQVTTADGDGALFYGVPYLDPDDARYRLAVSEQEPLARSHEAVMGAAMRRIHQDLDARRSSAKARIPAVVVAHAFVVGGQASESERDIRVGGVDNVAGAVFAGVDYVALGHLHGPQRVQVVADAALGSVSDSTPTPTVARYSGSPLAYSFSEMNHRKSTALLTLGPDGVQGEPELISAPVPRKLSEVRGELDDLLGAAGDAHVDNWVRVHVTNPARPDDLQTRVKERFPHALMVLHEPPARERAAAMAHITAAADPLEVCTQFIEYVRGGTATEPEKLVLRGAVERVNAQEMSA